MKYKKREEKGKEMMISVKDWQTLSAEGQGVNIFSTLGCPNHSALPCSLRGRQRQYRKKWPEPDLACRP